MFTDLINSKWQIGHKTLNQITIKGDIFQFKNIRDIDHIANKSKRIDNNFDINKLENVNFITVPFGHKMLKSHIMLQYNFADNKSIVLSVEARRQPGEKFSTILGILRHYGLIFIWGTPNDLIGLRKDKRKEKVYSYQMKLSEKELRKSFEFYVNKTNSLFEKPEYYNTFFSSCVTNLWAAFNLKTKGRPSYNRKVLYSGKLDEYLYELGYLDNTISFEKLKQNSLLK